MRGTPVLLALLPHRSARRRPARSRPSLGPWPVRSPRSSGRSRARPRLLDERADDPRALVLLGMPEHAECELAVRQLNRLDHAIVGVAARNLEALTETVDTLMVV